MNLSHIILAIALKSKLWSLTWYFWAWLIYRAHNFTDSIRNKFSYLSGYGKIQDVISIKKTVGSSSVPQTERIDTKRYILQINTISCF